MTARLLPWLAALSVLCGCGERERLHILTGEAMGTTYRIKTVESADDMVPEIQAMLAGLDRDLSTWRDDSWVAKFNRAAAGTTLDIPDSVAELIALSQKFHARTEGRFDPTLGALIRVWGFGAWRGKTPSEPAPDAVTAAREACGLHHLRLEGRRVTKLHDGLMLDFSGIAKGYAVDRMGGLLRESGRADFVIDFGGDVLASGKRPGGTGWTVGGAALDRPVTLVNEALAGSGSEHQFRGSHTHVIDPQRGRPVPVGPPVTARAPTCAEADALATARMVEAAALR
ncbi:MAG: FAD:protein FMN transferase [Akkermansiaceae bacterium]